MTHQVIEAHFDAVTTGLLQAARECLHENGFGSPPAGVPHLSLSSFQKSDFRIWQNHLPKLTAQAKIDVRFSYLGIFQGENFIVYMGIIPTIKLNALHEDIHQVGLSAATALHSHYYPDQITFHTTLAAPVARQDLGTVIDILTGLDLPKNGTLCQLALVEYFPAIPLLVEDFIP